jgi:hypothetical protein
MRRINLRKLTILGALLCFALVLTAAPAQAALILRLTSGADSVTVTDGDANDACPLLGCVTYIGDVGVFTVNVSTGLSDPLLGGDSFAQMDLNSVNLSTSTGTLLIEFTDTDFAATGSGTLVGDVGGTVGTGGTAEFWAYKCERTRSSARPSRYLACTWARSAPARSPAATPPHTALSTRIR